jgi:hypothetical protein
MFRTVTKTREQIQINDIVRDGLRKYIVTDVFHNTDETIAYAAPVNNPKSKIKIRIELTADETIKTYPQK